ncbi:MAG: hypothetical protein K0Q66_210 [Chitinophagaceae bacterium]|jgi:hypothetical protein|nr:hypothetical protein [Chitinophagaceae bacterium]
MNPDFARFRKRLLHPVNYRAFLLSRLPLVYFTGIRIAALSEESCTTTVKYSWLNQNPFRSLYFAVMQMAAELSTGTLCMGNIYGQKPSPSMLVVKTEGVYHKKAIGKVSFTCDDGNAITAAVQQARHSAEGVPIRCYSVARNEAGEVVAEFWITWSFKTKQQG